MLFLFWHPKATGSAAPVPPVVTEASVTMSTRVTGAVSVTPVETAAVTMSTVVTGSLEMA